MRRRRDPSSGVLMFVVALLLGMLLLATCAEARDRNQVRAFRATHPCPATGLTRGACPGYVVDHIIPLCAGGPDTPANMQWQTAAAAKAKDKHEISYCACLRRHGTACEMRKVESLGAIG